MSHMGGELGRSLGIQGWNKRSQNPWPCEWHQWSILELWRLSAALSPTWCPHAPLQSGVLAQQHPVAHFCSFKRMLMASMMLIFRGYTLVNVYKKLWKNPPFLMGTSLFQWPFSIAMLNYQRVCFFLLYPDIVNLAQRDLVHIGTMVRRVCRRS